MLSSPFRLMFPRNERQEEAGCRSATELTKLREEFVKATNDYKASLAKLLPIYEGNVTKAEEKLELSRKLLAEGLISRTQVEENERALAAAKDKVDGNAAADDQRRRADRCHVR